MPLRHGIRESRELGSGLRAHPRFAIGASCRFWWMSPAGECDFGCGRTSDLSVQGMSVMAEVLPPLGSPLMIEVDLPGLHRTDPLAVDLSDALAAAHRKDMVLLLATEGVVLRHHADRGGFSVAITHASVHPQNKETPE